MADPKPTQQYYSNPRTAPGGGMVSSDYTGSYDEWRERVVNDLIRRYVEGRGGIGSDDPELGKPSPEDMGSGASGKEGQYSYATVQYWERFVDKYGATDPFVAENYGPAPGKKATYTADPNKPGAIQDKHDTWQTGENDKDRDWNTGENAKDRDFNAGESQKDRDFQGGENDKNRAVDQARIDNDWKIAQLGADIDLKRIEAQKYDTDSRERIALQDRIDQMERLKLQLEDNGKQRGWQTDENEKERLGLMARDQAQRDFEGHENEMDRIFQEAQQNRDLSFRAGESQKERDARLQEGREQRTFEGGQNEADRGLRREENTEQTRQFEKSLEDQRQARLLEDATRRYIAEGDWGTQRYVAELNNSGQLERLNLDLGFRREELAQRAVEAKNAHHETMVGLALEVAKYDADLANEPRNWVKYANWLKNRDIVVDGMSLAMASQEVPDASISPEEGASDPAGAVSNAITAAATPAAGTNADGSQTDPAQGTEGVDLNGDPAEVARQLLAKNPSSGVNGVDNSPEAMAATAAALDTTGHIEGQPSPQEPQVLAAPVVAPAGTPSMQSAVGGTGAPVPTAAPVTPPNPTMPGQSLAGGKQDYRKFAHLLPGQQQMKMGQVEAAGGYAEDFLAQMAKAKPKGGKVATSSYG